MNLRDRVIHAVLNALFVRRDIELDGDLYLRRWYLRGRGTDSQWFLHNIRKPDPGRELHDHPWDFTTRILSGGYVEHVAEFEAVTEIVARDAGDAMTHSAEHTHRIASVRDGTYTLVNAGPARRVWGFWCDFRDGGPSEWLPWRDYLNTPNAAEWPEDQIR